MVFALWYRYWPFVVLAAASAAVFGRTLAGDFLSWDDTQHILVNPWLQAGDIGRFWRGEYYGFYIPVTYSIWTIIYGIWPDPLPFHILNLALHTLNSFFVYYLARKTLASRASDAVELGEWGRQTFALIAALIFAVHPLQVETVAWISGGRDLLSAFFGLSAAIVAWNTSDRLFPSWAAVLRRLGATAMFVGGLLCKPGLVALPIALKWLSWFTERRGLKWSMMWAWIALAAATAGFTAELQAPFVRDRVVALAWPERLYVAFDSLFFYALKLVSFTELSADYGRTPDMVLAGGSLVPSWPFLVLGFLVAAVLYLILPRAVSGGLGFAVLMLAPVLGLVGFGGQAQSTVFDRYMYLPMVGVGLAVAAVVGESKTRLELRILGACILIGYLSWTSFERAAVWRSDEALFGDVVERNPKSYDAWVNLGIAAAKKGDLVNARERFTRARGLNPKMAIALANLSHLAWLEKKPSEVIETTNQLKDETFLYYNRHDGAALALMWRMRARAEWDANSRPDLARISYCLALERDPLDADLRAETEHFFAKNSNLEPCAAIPAAQ